MGEIERLVGNRIKSRLEKLGMTQKELAVRTGISEAGICRYIQGKRTPTLSNAKRIADALDVKIGYLVGEE